MRNPFNTQFGAALALVIAAFIVAGLLALALPARAADEPATHFLLVLLPGDRLGLPSTGSPIPFASADECHAVARKANFAERDRLRAANAEYVCFKIERVTV